MNGYPPQPGYPHMAGYPTQTGYPQYGCPPPPMSAPMPPHMCPMPPPQTMPYPPMGTFLPIHHRNLVPKFHSCRPTPIPGHVDGFIWRSGSCWRGTSFHLWPAHGSRCSSSHVLWISFPGPASWWLSSLLNIASPLARYEWPPSISLALHSVCVFFLKNGFVSELQLFMV